MCFAFPSLLLLMENDPMKKLLILAAVAMLTINTVGCCKFRNRAQRGAVCTPPVMTPVTAGYGCCNECPDYTAGYGGDMMMGDFGAPGCCGSGSTSGTVIMPTPES